MDAHELGVMFCLSVRDECGSGERSIRLFLQDNAMRFFTIRAGQFLHVAAQVTNNLELAP